MSVYVEVEITKEIWDIVDKLGVSAENYILESVSLRNKQESANPGYIKLAKIAYDTVLQTMLEGEKEHGADEWKEQCVTSHLRHAESHIEHAVSYHSGEDHIAHAMTRCAMIKYLEDKP